VPTIVSICQSAALSESLRLLLEGRGYDILFITDVRELDKIKTVPRCSVMGIDIEPKMKRAAAGLLKKKWPGISILEINSAHPEIEGAACVASDGPEEVLAALNGLLLPRGRKYSEYLRHQARDLSKRARSNVRRSEELAAWIAQQGKKSGRRVRRDHPKKKADN
jgi:hypothetical protein